MRKTRRVSPSPAKKGRPKREVKDRLVQTRVPEHLEHVLKQEAQKRRLTVSHLIRNMLEDTLDLVDTVVTGAGEIIDTSAGIAREVKRDAERLATTARDAVKSRTPTEPGKPAHDPASEAAAVPEDRVTQPSQVAPAPPAAPGALDHVLAWNAVVVNRPARCASCSAELSKGTPAHLGVTTDPTAPPAWLCAACLAKL
jgi:hypothetical protein